jgi:predicted esterase
MKTASLIEFRNEFFRLYYEKVYLQAFDLAEEWKKRSAQAKSQVTCWQICSAALAGRPDLAMETFRQAMADGFFWPPEGLRRDPDLAVMQNDPEYQHLVDQCGERLEQARQDSQPTLHTILPMGDGPHPLLLAFHGWGQSIEDFAPHWKSSAEAGWIVAVAQSSQVYAKDTCVWDDLEKATGEAKTHYQTLCAQYPIDRQRVVVAGFSQGGGVALLLALTQRFPVQGFIGVGPYLPSLKESMPQPANTTIPGLRASLITGQNEKDDGMFAAIEQAFQSLAVPYQHDRIPDLGHEFPPDFSARLQAALAFLFA